MNFMMRQFQQQVIDIYNKKQHTGKRRAYIEKSFFEQINLFYPKLEPHNISKLYYWIINNLEDDPTCLICGDKVTKFRSVRDGYNSKYCSIKCGIIGNDRKSKTKQTCLKKYDVEYPNQAKQIRNKTKATCLERYGVENPQQSIMIKDKSKKACLIKYGVENAMQNSIIFDKQQTSSLRKRPFIFNSGKIIKIQGFEDVAINFLIANGFNEDKLVFSAKFMPKIIYQFGGHDKRYYPDIFIPSENKIIEVKSTYTYENSLKQNICKINAAVLLGLFAELWICDKHQVIKKIMGPIGPII